MTVSITRRTEPTVPIPQGEVVLSVKNVSKKFCRDLKRSLFYGVIDIAKEVTGLSTERDRLRVREFWALKDVSFELRRGSAVGLIGKNGSGKSTLLRIIAGLIKPDLGLVEVNGRIAALIALGAGFNPILTGRENVYANMSILGLSKPEIDARFEDVIEFAEIGDAIDAPVQSYSSGMAARLGFASAIHTDPDILLIDEVLAVGDVKFRAKCHRKLHDLRQRGTSFILVSHNSQAILGTCEQSVYLSQGNLLAVGDTDTVMSRYEEDLFLTNTENSYVKPAFEPKFNSTGLDITALCFRDINGQEIESPVTGEATYVCVTCKAETNIDDIGLHLAIKEMLGESDYTLILNSFNDNISLHLDSGEHEVRLFMPYMGLRPGIYTMMVAIKRDSFCTLDFVESFRFSVRGNGQPMNKCLFYQPRDWDIA